MDLTHLFSLANLPTGLVIALIIFVLYEKFWSKRTREHQQADENLVKIFRETIQELEKKVNTLSDDLDRTNAELNTIKREYATVIQILQGKDDSFIKYQERGMKIMDTVEKTIIPQLDRIEDKIQKYHA